MVEQICKTAGNPIKGHISKCTRIAKLNKDSPRPRTVLVKFFSPIIRDQFYANIIKNLVKRVKEKEKYRIRFKKFGYPLDEIEFKLQRFRCELLINSCYKRYTDRVEASIKSHTKYFWTYLKQRRKNKCEFPASMVYNNQTFTDGVSICD
ncbi:unnamed protein product [Leptidea sinapis]|uniref:Uncharacterized protein n=1 Tax=Leptidea sinapis TaxID=189913 RepID=A0A5E4PT32_9NEOP|nr:unnamed protein product [Leptidea sinapis]